MNQNVSLSLTRYNRVAFPIVAQIRTGTKKTVAENGKTRPGQDLGLKFRVEFKPGNEDAKEAFLATYKTLTPDRIFSVLCFPQLQQHWSVYNEAYTSGRMVAQANADHYITLMDPSNWEYVVKDGEPYKEYKVGDTVEYVRTIKGEARRFSLPLKPSGRLRLWLPDIKGRMVMFELKTTSFYSSLNIAEQLMTIQAMANGRGKTLAGVPIWIYRIPAEIPFLDPKDGVYKRVTKNLINIEVDPSYMMTLMGAAQQYALDFSSGTAPSLPSGPVVIDEVSTPDKLDESDPEDGDVDDGAEEIDGVPAEPEQPPAPEEPEQPPVAEPQDQGKSDPDAKERAKAARPYQPMQLRARLAEIAGQIKEGAINGGQWTREKAGILIHVMEVALSGETPDPRVARGEVTNFLVASKSMDTIAHHWALAMYAWLQPTQDEGGEWKCRGVVNTEITAVYNHIREQAKDTPVEF